MVLRDYNAAVDFVGKEPEQAAQDGSALSVFFNPRSVAVVGASSDPKKPGNTALRHMISMGYKGKLFPVNPREKGMAGQGAFSPGSAGGVDSPARAAGRRDKPGGVRPAMILI